MLTEVLARNCRHAASPTLRVRVILQVSNTTYVQFIEIHPLLLPWSWTIAPVVECEARMLFERLQAALSGVSALIAGFTFPIQDSPVTHG